MTLQDFARLTINVIQEDGSDVYLPTFVLPDTQQLRIIEGIPPDVDHRDAVQNVVRRSGYVTQEFFFGVQSAPQQITIGHFRPGQPMEFMKISETPNGYAVSAVAACDWWKLS